jgi:hypothetical protein
MRKKRSAPTSDSITAEDTSNKRPKKDLDPTTNDRLAEDLLEKLKNGIDSMAHL